jgi:hypothetical protein
VPRSGDMLFFSIVLVKPSRRLADLCGHDSAALSLAQVGEKNLAISILVLYLCSTQLQTSWV